MDFVTHPVARKAFKVKAVIDWLVVTVRTSRPTQFQHLQSAIMKAGCGKLRVETIEEGSGGVADTFTIRFHDELANDYAALKAKLDQVSKDYPFLVEPAITAIEVACDFWHKGQVQTRIRDTLAMTYRLQSSLFAKATKPRQFDPTIGEKGANRFMDEGTRLDPDLNFRIGNKWDEVSWQAYFKSVDKKKCLPQAQWRARVEVTLQGKVLQDLGLNTLPALQSYKFDRLAKFFRFRRPVEPERLAKGDLYKLTAILANRRINDAAPQRGMHSFNTIGRRDKWRNDRAESQHIEPDHELQDAVKGALRRLRF